MISRVESEKTKRNERPLALDRAALEPPICTGWLAIFPGRAKRHREREREIERESRTIDRRIRGSSAVAQDRGRPVTLVPSAPPAARVESSLAEAISAPGWGEGGSSGRGEGGGREKEGAKNRRKNRQWDNTLSTRGHLQVPRPLAGASRSLLFGELDSAGFHGEMSAAVSSSVA